MKHRKLVKESPNTVKMWWKTGRLNDVKITSDQRVDIGNSQVCKISARLNNENLVKTVLQDLNATEKQKKKWKDKK